MLVNHQVRKTQTMIETVQARLEDLSNVAAEFDGFSLRQNWKTESWHDLSLLKSLVGNLLRTGVHVFSDSVYGMWEITTP